MGRDEQAEEVALRIRRSRLVTRTGTGGIGKTRLELAAAEIVRTEFTQGGWFVDLSALLDPNRIVQTIFAVLKLRVKPGSDLRTMLTDLNKVLSINMIARMNQSDVFDALYTAHGGSVTAFTPEPGAVSFRPD